MSTEILQPFQLGSNGEIATTTDPNVQTDQHLLALVSVQPGERVMLPTYGVASYHALFSMNSDSNRLQFINSVNVALSTWEPNVKATVNFVNQASDLTGEMDIAIDWTAGNEFTSIAQGITTATVLVGGTVVEN